MALRMVNGRLPLASAICAYDSPCANSVRISRSRVVRRSGGGSTYPSHNPKTPESSFPRSAPTNRGPENYQLRPITAVYNKAIARPQTVDGPARDEWSSRNGSSQPADSQRESAGLSGFVGGGLYGIGSSGKTVLYPGVSVRGTLTPKPQSTEKMSVAAEGAKSAPVHLG